MFLGPLVLVLVLAAAPVPRPQDRSAVDHWIQKQFEAIAVYRKGDLILAVELLNAMSAEEQEKAVKAIEAQVARIAAGWPPRKEDVVPWTAELLRALGALHMEAALAARPSHGRDSRPMFDRHAALARTLFSAVALLTKQDDSSAARWLLAMGLEQMASAEFGAAYRILLPACEEHEKFAPLLVACGTVHETYGSFPADAGLPAGNSLATGLPASTSYHARRLADARARRSRQLNPARRFFERAIALDPADDEAPLRLANVRMQQDDLDEAARILERLLQRPSLDERRSYLVRLFLARIRDRQNRVDEATALLNKIQPLQSGLLEQAHNALRRGNAREAASFAERAARATPDDPWWGYRFGQYWIPQGLFKQLREEALK